MSESLPANAKPFEFRGNAKEWFGIWIVNLLLSIVTIGIVARGGLVAIIDRICSSRMLLSSARVYDA